MANVLVVGGGIIGVCTTHSLTLRGAKVTLLEQAPQIALGASGKAGGLLALDWHGPSTAALSALSYRLHQEWAEEHGGEEKWGYRTLDTLSISVDLNSSSAKIKGGGAKEGSEWLDPKVTKKTEVLGGKETTAQVHPYLFTTGIAKIAQSNGATIKTSSRLESLKKGEDGQWTANASSLDSPDQKEELQGFSHVVIAAGPWTGQVLTKLGYAGKTKRAGNITGSRAHSIVVRPPEGKILPAQALFTSIKTKEKGHAEPEIYNRPDGTAYACGPTDSSSLPSSPHLVEVNPSSTSSIYSQISLLSPDFFGKGSKLEKEQACYLPVGSGDPVIGEVEGVGGLIVASGHSCWGITNGPGTGHVVAEIILDGGPKSAKIAMLSP